MYGTETEAKASCMLGKCSPSDLYPSPLESGFGGEKVLLSEADAGWRLVKAFSRAHKPSRLELPFLKRPRDFTNEAISF